MFKNKVKRFEITNKIKLTHTHKIKFTLILVFPVCRGIIHTYSYRILNFGPPCLQGYCFSVIIFCLVFPVPWGIIRAYSYRHLSISEIRYGKVMMLKKAKHNIKTIILTSLSETGNGKVMMLNQAKPFIKIIIIIA